MIVSPNYLFSFISDRSFILFTIIVNPYVRERIVEFFLKTKFFICQQFSKNETHKQVYWWNLFIMIVIFFLSLLFAVCSIDINFEAKSDFIHKKSLV